MDCAKVGNLIREIRKEKNMTQLELAESIGVSDKAVSKWERGLGCPDITLLGELSEILGIDIEGILSGDISVNEAVGGNMKRIKFYVCPECGNIITATGDASVSCCSRKLEPLEAKPVDEAHSLKKEELDGEWYISFEHEMIKEHFITFIAYSDMNKLHMVKLYPEQNAEVCMSKMRGGKMYWCCSKHGLFCE